MIMTFMLKLLEKKKIDIMGPISVTADRLHLSVRQSCTNAASVANTPSLDIDDTNISCYSAWCMARQGRLS